MRKLIEEDVLLSVVGGLHFRVEDPELLFSPLGQVRNHLNYTPYYLGLKKERPLGPPLVKSQVAYIALCYLDYFSGIRALEHGNNQLALAVFLRFLNEEGYTCQLRSESVRDLLMRFVEDNEDMKNQNYGHKDARGLRLRKYHKIVEESLSMEQT
ncbi:hypothetical protein P0082_01245 [Candidatus Haliotispira prima]|uniref:Uncharacterized protein n=1 Tax=Candidatus Haliotispira prima TaxID=3034016 RepID=A0ABY8MHK9_9SPIO|nr:hypothetical protein P0082_01245 [Candidatus Haliotispira prima]